MNELQKRFEKDTALPSYYNADGVFIAFSGCYVRWLEDQLRWRDPKEEPPTEENTYLVLPRKWGLTAEYNIAGKFDKKWTRDDENGYEHEVVVTSYMPLPEPKGE